MTCWYNSWIRKVSIDENLSSAIFFCQLIPDRLFKKKRWDFNHEPARFLANISPPNGSSKDFLESNHEISLI